jgi:endo-1,4-beta-xylanase
VSDLSSHLDQCDHRKLMSLSPLFLSRDSIYWRNLGYDMFVIAFKAANRAKWETQSNVKLYINEMTIEGTYQNNQKKVQAMLDLIDKLKELKVNFDGIGLQGHLIVDDFPSDLAQGIKKFTDRSLEVSITELDIRIHNNDQSEATLNKQATQYAMVYDACLANPRCKMVVRWNIDDDHSWIPSGIPGWGSATMFGSKCQVKPRIFNAVHKVLAKYA